MAILTVPKVLREKLGDEGVEALINLLNEAAHHERNNLLGIVEERFARRVAETEKRLDNRITEVEAVLRHVPTALVALAAVTVVVGVVLLAQWLDKHHVPLPPVPPPEVVETVFYLSLDLARWGWIGVADASPPAVTSHFPVEGAVVAARRPRVIFAMSEPLQAGELEARGVTVLGARSGLVPGVVSYDDEHWWVIWEAQEDLAPGDTFHVTLDADAVEDLGGNELPGPVSFTFRSAP